MIRIVTQVLPVYVGDNVKLECQTESNPLADHYWYRNGDHILPSSYVSNSIVHKKRHRLHNKQFGDKRNQTNRKYQIYLNKIIQFKYLFQLQINYVTHEDSGMYVCQLSNLIGEAQSAIQLKGKNLKLRLFD